MEPTLTEFSYGFCVTQELANSANGVKAAPYFPSLLMEGKPGGGFDVKIGSALFMQFKLSDELKRRSAYETKINLLEPPFFRFWIHRRNRSNQHKLLIDLENIPGNQVYYIAPLFSTVAKLDEAYASKNVVNQSAMFSPSEIGQLPDDDYHRISFKPNTGLGWFLSEPHKVRRYSKEAILEGALKPFESIPREIHDWLGDLERRMLTIISQHFPRKRRENPGNEPISGDASARLLRIAYLARTFSDASFSFSGTPGNQHG